MMRRSRFTLFRSYLICRRREVFLFMIFGLIFLVVFYLYNIHLEAYLYAILLCAIIGIASLSLDYFRYCSKYRVLENMKHHLALQLHEFPKPSYVLEEEYQRLLQILNDDKLLYISKVDNARTDLIDYFTLWAHQIKTPISAMTLLVQSDEKEQNRELLLELFRIEEYVNMVLQYLRLESESSDFVIMHYDLDRIIRQSIRKYAKLFIRKNIKLDFINSHFQVLTDEKWLAFVIEQILSNAIKYTKEGKISIYMEPDTYVLVIEDSGIGIAEEDLPRIFEKGYTGYNGRIHKKSTGIGLYLCKQILNKLAHRISIESKVGVGTRVKIGLKSLNLTVE